jgi:GT2 family glycosyltransferase
MKLSIIIVNWNVRTLLERCLTSIEQHKGSVELEVFVVDNASTDESGDYLMFYESNTQKNEKHDLYEQFTFIENENNLGFARANNQAIEKTTGEYILLLNPDTELTDGALGAMLDTMERRPRCGVLGAKLIEDDGATQQSVRRFPDWISPTLMSLGIVAGPAHAYLARDFDYEQEQKVDQVMGACFLIRRELLDAIGSLDERFFLWFEEVDFCLRAQEAGWEVWYTPTAMVHHLGGKSFESAFTAKKQQVFFSSLLYYFRKHHQWGAWLFNVTFYPLRLIIAQCISITQVGRRKMM